MRLQSLLLAVAAVALTTTEIVSATDSNALNAAEPIAPLHVEGTRFLRSETVDEDDDSTDVSEESEEERGFQVQALNNFAKRQKALHQKLLTKGFTEQEIKVFKQWVSEKETPKTMYKLFALRRDPTKSSDLYKTWRKFKRYYGIVKPKKKSA